MLLLILSYLDFKFIQESRICIVSLCEFKCSMWGLGDFATSFACLFNSNILTYLSNHFSLILIPERFPNDGNVVEEWSKFPEARQLLYDTILNSGVKSPMIVSGDVHMAQFMKKDCVKASGMIQSRSSISNPQVVRPLVEITTSGMTHSWGTSFSSQPKHHRLPLKPYSYFVSRVFMTICHWVCGWNDILL